MTEVQNYPYVRVHLCEECGDGFEGGDELVSISDGFADADVDYVVENRRFWHKDCWTPQERCAGDSE